LIERIELIGLCSIERDMAANGQLPQNCGTKVLARETRAGFDTDLPHKDLTAGVNAASKSPRF